MILTIIYGLICLFSGGISIDYTILTATVLLDIVGMVCGKTWFKVKFK